MIAKNFIFGLLALILSAPPACANPNDCYPDRFSALDTDGHEFTEKDLIGAPTLMYFGYGTCGAECPMALGNITGWLEKMGPSKNKFHVVFVSVDPEHDTAKDLKDFIGNFGSRARGVLPSLCNLQVMAKRYEVQYDEIQRARRTKFQHDDQIILIDSTGTTRGKIKPEVPDAEALAALKALLKPAR